jgi:hypothetical protein
MSEPERYRLTLRALPDNTLVAIRLRHVLKGLLRAWGFRAERVEQLQPDGSEAEQTPALPAPIAGDQIGPAENLERLEGGN